ncbi:MAG: Zn-ribbon domain-containing OB-fold protein [Haloarculaceae archaeon]
MVEAHTHPFWEALADGTVLLQRCTDCEEAYFPPGPVCPRCQSAAVEWIESAAAGDLYAFTRQHRTAPGVPSPVVLGVVELDEGPRLLARVAADYEALSLGDRVAIEACDYEGAVDRGRLDGEPFFRAVPRSE